MAYARRIRTLIRSQLRCPVLCPIAARRCQAAGDDSSPFTTVKRTYALRSSTYAEALARMNAKLGAKWLDRSGVGVKHFIFGSPW